MGKFGKGILGPFSGKVGTVIGAVREGEWTMRSLPSKSSKPATAAQLAQRAAFGLMIGFFRPIGPVLKAGFRNRKRGQSANNAAMQYNLNEAIVGVYPDLSLDYSKITLSRGPLLEPPVMDVSAAVDAQLDFSWLNNAGTGLGNTNGTDKVTIVVYNAVKDRFVVVQDAVARSTQSYALSLPPDFSGDSVDIWVFFISADGKHASDSVYLGDMDIA
ncbi:DUF6266 family protein [Pedobacter faecalis]|uniref:DUF6266 family protein n=1 Tax=Pedobacter faecalis TaxID=3041495 RepID=UPI00254A7F19|nr:DUF6266 family protein [Pedobacter sp. ELA7]